QRRGLLAARRKALGTGESVGSPQCFSARRSARRVRPALTRTARLRYSEQEALDRGVLHARGLAVGVAASLVPVSRAGLSPRPWSGGPMRLWAGDYAMRPRCA